MHNKIIIKTTYGNFEIGQPFIDLINSPAMQRLKKISMGGITNFVKGSDYKDYCRYEHSLNVLALLIKYEAGKEEQIAGLLHDISHTAFSHVGDILFRGTQNECYQDDVHEWFLKHQGIDSLLEKYNVSINAILHKEGDFKRLEQNLPDICIDRLDYNIQVALNNKIINTQELNQILESLKFEDDKWFFTDVEMAKLFAKIPLYFNKNYWASPSQILAYSLTANAMQRAMDLKILTTDEIHFSDDLTVWQKLKNSGDKQILQYLNHVENVKQIFKLSAHDNCDTILTGKFRGIDPWVKVTPLKVKSLEITSPKVDKNLVRLTDLDSEFKSEFENIKNIINSGWPIKFVL